MAGLVEVLGVDLVRRLALSPHLHNDDTYRQTMQSLLDSSDNLRNRGMAIWLVGRVLQLEEGDANYKDRTLCRSKEVINAALEITGMAKREIIGQVGGGKSTGSDSSSRTISKNASLLVTILTEYLADPASVSERFSSRKSSFARMEVVSVGDGPDDDGDQGSQQFRAASEGPLQHPLLQGRGHSSRAATNACRRPNKMDKTLQMRSAKGKHSSNNSQNKLEAFIPNKDHENESKVAYTKMKNSSKLVHSRVGVQRGKDGAASRSAGVRQSKVASCGIGTPLYSDSRPQQMRDAQYCHDRDISNAIEKLNVAAVKSMASSALSTWQVAVRELRQRERDLAARREAGARGIKVALADIVLRQYCRALERWRGYVADVIFAERQYSARVMQKALLQFVGLCRFVRLHRFRVANGPLADIYLSPPRPGLRFSIHPLVRQERRAVWISAIRIQSFYRSLQWQRKFAVSTKSAVIIQATFRSKVLRESFRQMRKDAIVLQSLFRMLAVRVYNRKALVASVEICRVFRGHIARKRLLASAMLVRFMRLFRARYIVARTRQQRAAEFHAALRLQRVWYRRNEQFSTFVLLCCLRVTDKIELEFRQMIESRFRRSKAKRIQLYYKAYFRRTRNAAAYRIQRFTLLALTRKHNRQKNLERSSAICLQRHWRSLLQRKSKAASQIMFYWLRNKKGRLLNHFVLLKRLKEKQRQEAIRKRRLYAVTLLQSYARAWLGWRRFRSLKRAQSLQRITKKLLQLSRRAELLRIGRRKISSSFVSNAIQQCIDSLQRREDDTLEATATVAKTFVMSVSIDAIVCVDDKRMHREHNAAKIIQYRFRSFSVKRDAKCELLRRRRHAKNPFGASTQVDEVVIQCTIKTKCLFHPENELCGISLLSLMRRMGMVRDVLPLLLNKGIVSTQQLHSIAHGDLKDVRVCNEDAVDIFALIKTIDLVVPDVDTVHSVFEALSKDSRQMFLDFGIIPRSGKESVIEELFKLSYGEKFAARAANFARNEDVLALPLTKMQLKRYFARSKTPSAAKENVADLVSESSIDTFERTILSQGSDKLHQQGPRIDNAVPPYLDEDKWDHFRLEQCMDTLLYAAEHISTLMNWDDLDEIVLLTERDLLSLDAKRLAPNNRVQSRLQQSCTSLYKILYNAFELHIACLRIQTLARGYFSRKHVSTRRRNDFLALATQRYLTHKRDNHVKRVWTHYREEEEEEYARQYREWIEAERRAEIEAELYESLRFGWTVAWRAAHESDETMGMWVYVKDGDEDSASLDRPIYTFNEYMAANDILRWVRSFIVRRRVMNELRFEYREEKKARERMAWEEAQIQKGADATLLAFEENYCAEIIQSAWRALIGRRRFIHVLKSQSILDVLEQSVKGASRESWYGFSLEGMTIEMWLGRLGLFQYVDAIQSWYTRQLEQKKRRTTRMPNRGKGAALKRHVVKENRIDLQSFLRSAKDDNRLKEMGVSNSKDRELILSMKDAAPSDHVYSNFELMNYFGSNDSRSMTECIRQSSPLLRKHVLKTFPNNPQRVDRIVDKIIQSNYPISLHMLNRFLLKYNGKPALALQNVEELYVPTTGAAREEREAYKILQRGVEKAVCLLNNLKMNRLANILASPLNNAHKLLQLTSNQENDFQINTNSNVCSGHEAKAALILRRDAIEVVMHWWECAVCIQMVYRSHLRLAMLRRVLNDRRKSATRLQSFARRCAARVQAAFLLEQRQSSIEQLWSDELNVYYWYDKDSGDSTWEEPDEPYRPMVRHQLSRKLIQAWPTNLGSHDSTDTAAALVPKCSLCKINIATRRCDNCDENEPGQDHGGNMFCFLCFVTEHEQNAEMRSHSYSIEQLPAPAPMRCCACNNLAERRCLGLCIKESVHESLADLIREVDSDEDTLSRDEFVDTVTKLLKVPFSRERARAMFHDIGGSNDDLGKANVWRRFQQSLVMIGKECNENYCASCWDATHAKGSRSKHQWQGFQLSCAVCSECEILPARLACLTCRDDYCTDCSASFHRNGRRSHELIEIKEMLLPGQDYCQCGYRIATEQCGMCSASCCDSCARFIHPKECPVRLQLRGINDDPIECCVCKKPPDTQCIECQDVYCSVVWTGNPGCFRSVHCKGKRRLHQTQPYTIIQDRVRAVELEKAEEAEEMKRLRDQQQAEELKAVERQEALKRKRWEEEAILFEEATAEFMAKQRKLAEERKARKKPPKETLQRGLNSLYSAFIKRLRGVRVHVGIPRPVSSS